MGTHLQSARVLSGVTLLGSTLRVVVIRWGLDMRLSAIFSGALARAVPQNMVSSMANRVRVRVRVRGRREASLETERSGVEGEAVNLQA